MCRQVIRQYPLCGPDQEHPPWHETTDETIACQEAVNQGGQVCEEFEPPEYRIIKNSRCPPCLMHQRQGHEANEAWERQALEESERLAAEHAEQVRQREVGLAQQEEEELQRILRESEEMAQQAPPPQAFVDDEEELQRAIRESEEAAKNAPGHQGFIDDDDEMRKAIEASMGSTLEDEQRRSALGAGPKVYLMRHVKKLCCGEVTKVPTDIEKDAMGDGLPFLEEEDDMPCEKCVRRMIAEQDAWQYGGSSHGADVPAFGSGSQPIPFMEPSSGLDIGTSASHSFPPQPQPQPMDGIDLDPAGRGKAPLYTIPQNQTSHNASAPQGAPPNYATAWDSPSSEPAANSPNPEVTPLIDLTPEEEEEEIRKQRERHALMNASPAVQGHYPAASSSPIHSNFNEPPPFEEPDDSRPASPNRVFAQSSSEDAARNHLATARANLFTRRGAPQMASAPAQTQGFRGGGEEDEEEADMLGDLPSAGSQRQTPHSGAPSASAFRRGGLRPAPQVQGSSSGSSWQPQGGEMQREGSGGPGDHDWDHDWLREEERQEAGERLPSFMSSIDLSRGTKPVDGQENE
ncbi:MAG: hypothetical protein M1820_007921 [Bogoriella megaspora]|nr:MAG: hypothetical protein M1820_007921 [Bogoriella megaspora]